MALNPAGTEFSTSAPFDCIAVTDTTSGGAPFVAQAQALPLTDSTPPSPLPAGAFTSINPENVGLTNLSKPASGDTLCSDTQSYSGATGTTDNPASEPGFRRATPVRLGWAARRRTSSPAAEVSAR